MHSSAIAGEVYHIYGAARCATGRHTPSDTVNPSEEQLRERQKTLLPGDAVADAALSGELGEMRDVPVVVPYERLLVGVLRPVAQQLLGLLYRDERIRRSRLVDPWIERREMELLENAEDEDDGLL